MAYRLGCECPVQKPDALLHTITSGDSMSIFSLALLALAPIALVLVLMVGLRWPATRAMPLTWLVAAGLAAAIWGNASHAHRSLYLEWVR